MSDPVDVCVVAMLPLFSHDDCGWPTPFQLRRGSCWSVSPVVAHVTWLKNNRLAHILSQQGTSQAEVGVSLNHGLVGLLSQAQLLHELLRRIQVCWITEGRFLRQQAGHMWRVAQHPLYGAVSMDIWNPVQLRHNVGQGNDEGILVSCDTRVGFQKEGNRPPCHLMSSLQNGQSRMRLPGRNYQVDPMFSCLFSHCI